MLLWLRNAISDVGCVRTAFVFGSVARNAVCPNDCDLALISDATPLSAEWAQLRDKIANIRRSFKYNFQFPLSVVILSEIELIELDYFFEDRVSIVP